MIGSDQDSQNAIDYLRKLSQDFYTSFTLQPGDLLIIDNQKAMHSRTKFKARFDGTDRWLQRLLVAKSLSRALHDFGIRDRVIDLRFAL